MTSWKYKKLDKISKREKIKKAQKLKASDKKEKKDFSLLDQKQWDDYIKQGYFCARVVEVHKNYAFISPEPKELAIDNEDVWLATVAKKFLQNVRQERNFITVGEKVLCLQNTQSDKSEDLPQCTIEFRAPRRSQISRLDPLLKQREHVLASNISQIIIVSSYLNPRVKWGLIDRYLVLAEHEHIKATIIFNKKDLLAESDKESFISLCEDYEKLYKSLGYEVLSLQANKDKMDKKSEKALKNLFKNHITLLSGHSGVGKSSITNLLKPDIIQEVEKDEILTKGRHTTSYASLLKIAKSSYIIDTPGIRSFVLKDTDALTLTWGFVEMRPYLNKCQFRECTHHNEPKCAVKDAVEEGSISKMRYQSYLGLLLGNTGREGKATEES